MTAKETFLKHPLRAEFEKIAQSEAFQVAADYAMLAHLEQQPKHANLNQGWDAHSRMVGARDFLEILKEIHLPAKIQKPTRFENLKPV